ncbi:MAG: DUF3160 domain-containing protein [Patescibacteria group bacterium]|nr:DUF3160 domain-containing protein [Patescibacteria group bacterium]
MPKQKAKKSRGVNVILIILIVALVGLAGAGVYLYLANYSSGGKTGDIIQNIGDAIGDLVEPPVAVASRFADYEAVPVSFTARVPIYAVEADFANITNRDKFEFSSSAEELLAKDAFVVIPAAYKEFFSVYESNRYDNIPNFVTTDSILHNYHLLFDHLLKTVEEEYLAAELKNLNALMLAESEKQYEDLRGTAWENAAKRSVGFFAVGSKLLDSSIETPDYVSDLVNAELALIAAHQGIAVSPLMNAGARPLTPEPARQAYAGQAMAGGRSDGEQAPVNPVENLEEDYSQYIPRGHYDRSEELKAYFKSMMWYGRMTFRFKSDDETRSALLITVALMNESNKDVWERIYEPTNFFVGKSDDISFYDLGKLVEQVYGLETDSAGILGDENKFMNFWEGAKKLAPPQINSIPIFDESLNPDREREILGFRFMGQRFTLDASVFQRLVYREVKENPDGARRMLPKGLDIPAAMGSAEAYSILQQAGETKYENYPENMGKMREYIKGLDAETWTQNLYWGWLYSILPLTGKKDYGYPVFMTNLAWARKEINTYLGSWAELKHDTILYAKQVYAELGGGPQEQVDDRGYVEPNPYVYARLAALTKMTREGLDIRDLLSDDNQDNLARMEELTLSLKTISEKELENVSLTDDEYEIIRSFGGQLEHFWIEAFRNEGILSVSQLDDRPAAIIADVATDPRGYVLEEGVGNVSEILVIVPIDGALRIAKGGAFSYYEFPWPMSDRLTDGKWRELLETADAPELPDWTQEFTAE